MHVRLGRAAAALLLGAGVPAAMLMLVGAASNTPQAASKEPDAKDPGAEVCITDVPHVKQRPDFCGEACAEMWLGKLGEDWTQDDVFNESGLDPAKGRGCCTAELNAALKKIGFSTGPVKEHARAACAKADLDTRWRSLLADLERGVPSIVCMHYDDSPNTTEHFRLVLGYDPGRDEVIYHEPAVRSGDYQRMKKEKFLELWPLKYDRKSWTVIRMRLEGDRIKKKTGIDGHTPADYAQAVLAARKKAPAGFTILIEKPFVVAGDGGAWAVRRSAQSTVRWTVRLLKKDYFDKDPDAIITIWLFKDKASYRKHTWTLFADRPSTPYGYFSPSENALVMNIDTGGGTLVHEIVHPFVAANFPECPAWFNEGLGSLYEQSGERGGRIQGLTNWRLDGLQSAIKAKKLPPFEDFTAQSDREFYGGKYDATNYGQARYLCYYLQNKKLLVKFYHEFHKNREKDPTGYDTLKKILKREDMDAFKKEWEKYVMALKYPPST